MILLPLLALLLGVVLAWFVEPPVRGGFANYLSVAALAGLDSVVGGWRAIIERQFDAVRFSSGFVVNAIGAAALAYVGDLIGIDLFLAAAVVFGGRILVNFSIIRRHYLSRVENRREKRAPAPPE